MKSGTGIESLAGRLIEQGIEQARSSKLFVIVARPKGSERDELACDSVSEKLKDMVAVIEAYDSMTARGFIGAICRAVGESDKGTLDQALNRAISSLVQRPKVLVIEEADYLEVKSLNQLVHINNQARVGVVLMGTDDLYLSIERPALQRVRSRLKRSISIDEFISEPEPDAEGKVEPEGTRKKKVLKGKFGKAGSGQ